MNREKILEYLQRMKREASEVARAEEALLILFPGSVGGLHTSVTESQDMIAEILDDWLETDAVSFWLYEMECGNDPENCKMMGKDGRVYDISEAEGLLDLIDSEKLGKRTRIT